MIDIENIPLLENSIYVVYYSLNDCNISEAHSAFNNLTAAKVAMPIIIINNKIAIINFALVFFFPK